MVFKYLEFGDHWDRPNIQGRPVADDFGMWTQYIVAGDVGLLTVVTESNAGQVPYYTTYWFELRKGQIVQVCLNENLVFIPDKCIRRENGDKTTCKHVP